jgi:hypothetical protein
MRPLIEQMILAGTLTDAAGNKLTDMGGLHFAEPLSAAVDRLIEKLQELIDKFIAVGNTQVPPVHIPTIYDDPIYHGPSDQGYAAGGVVQAAQYAAAGARILSFPGGPRGTDTVPAWLTPGEGVINTAGMRRLGTGGLAAINRGAPTGPSVVVSMTEVTAELKAMRAEAARRDAMFSQQLARVVRDEVQKVARR